MDLGQGKSNLPRAGEVGGDGFCDPAGDFFFAHARRGLDHLREMGAVFLSAKSNR